MESSNMFVQTTSAGKTSPANCTLKRFYFFRIKFTFRTFGKKTAELIPLEFGDTFLNTDDNEWFSVTWLWNNFPSLVSKSNSGAGHFTKKDGIWKIQMTLACDMIFKQIFFLGIKITLWTFQNTDDNKWFSVTWLWNSFSSLVSKSHFGQSWHWMIVLGWFATKFLLWYRNSTNYINIICYFGF